MNVFLWILGGLVGLMAVVLAYIGLLYLTRGVHVRHVQAPGADAPGPGDKEFPGIVALHTRTDLTKGHGVELFTCGDEIYPRLWADLRGAKTSITVQMYYCQPGRMADEFTEIMAERARAGVRVLFLRDGFGSQNLPEENLEAMKSAGVTIAVFRPTRWYELHKVHHRSHIRVVVVDGVIGYTGGFGLDDKWYGDARHKDQWRDTSVRFVGPAVSQLQAIFAAGWGEATGELLTHEAFFPLDGVESGGNLKAGILHASPTVGSTAAERYLVLAIGSARKSVLIANSYFVPTTNLCDVIEATARRGVDVRILTPGPNSDVKSTYYAGRKAVDRLLQAGVRLYEYKPSMMHAKTTVTDGIWGAVGSLNFDNRSLSFNDETMLFVYDRDFGARMEEMFASDMEYCEEITLEKHRRRPFKRKVLEQLFGAFYRLL